MNTFSLKVIASDKVFFDGKCGIIIVPALDGEQAIMSHHEDMVIATKEGEVRFKEKEDDDWTKVVVGVGFVYISHNRVIMLVDTAELEYAEEFRYLATGGTVIGEVEKTIELPEEVQAPIQKGECAGRVVYKADGEELGSVAILYGADVARAGMWDLFGCTMKQYFLGTA